MLFADVMKKAAAKAPARQKAAAPSRAKAPAGPSVDARRRAVAAQPREPAGGPKGGQWTSSGFSARLRQAGLPADHTTSFAAKIEGAASGKAFSGQQAATPKQHVLGGPGRQHEVGDRAEALALAYVQQHVTPAAALLKQAGSKNNLPFDMIAHVPGKGVVLYEVKGGQPSNGRGAWQWRVTFDYRLTAQQQAKLGKMSETQLRQLQAAEATKRKKAMMAELEKQLRSAQLLGKAEKVQVETVGVIFDAHKKVTDIHVMPDVVERTGWTSERAAQGYRGTFRFKIAKAATSDVIREWGDALEAELMAYIPELLRKAKMLIQPHDAPVAEFTVAKMAEDRRYFGGWASIIEKAGEAVVDTQGHIIEEPTLIAAADGFMRSFRAGKVLHQGDADKIEYTESIVFTADVQKALGINLGKVGWWVGGYARDDATWAAIKDGRLKGLSIGGKAKIVDA